MAGRFLDANYWRNQFAVTDGDLDRLVVVLTEAGEPLWATRLLRQVVEHKLAREAQDLDPSQRAESEQAAERFLGDAAVYHPTGHYQVGQEIYVARQSLRGGRWQIGRGRVERVDRSQPEAAIEVQVPEHQDPWKFVCGLPPDHKWARDHLTPDSDRELSADQVLQSFSGDLLPHLLGRMHQDPRFVNWGDLWWLAGEIRPVTGDTLDQVYRTLLDCAAPAPTVQILPTLRGDWPATPGNLFSLNRALAASERFRNAATEAEPRWQASAPSHWVRLADGTWFDPSLPAETLWATHRVLFAGPLPAELRNHPDALQIYGRWLWRSLPIAIADKDLQIVRSHLEEAREARTDCEILAGFGRNPTDDDWLRWRFSLAWALRQSGEALGIEFVGLGDAWRWALHEAPVERPERHHPLPGSDRLPVQAIATSEDEIERELSVAESV